MPTEVLELAVSIITESVETYPDPSESAPQVRWKLEPYCRFAYDTFYCLTLEVYVGLYHWKVSKSLRMLPKINPQAKLPFFGSEIPDC